jgi:hypothetical protein
MPNFQQLDNGKPVKSPVILEWMEPMMADYCKIFQESILLNNFSRNLRIKLKVARYRFVIVTFLV